MDTREIAAEYRLSHWAQVMQERSTSGQSIRAYCETAGICEQVYYYWQRRLREAAFQELATTSAVETEKALVPSGWAMAKPTELAPTRAIVIEIGGCRVLAEPDSDAELLAKTCRMLKSLC